jgi:molybdopterin-guanine dinucleotide biosynthesis protein
MSSQQPFIISVTGAHSKVGKTSLCSILLGELKEFGAVKFTKTSLYTSLTDNINTLSTPGKDTAVFLDSGARRVVWIQSPYRELKSALEVAMSRMTGLSGVVVEGNSPVDFLNPHLIIFIIDPGGEVKPSAVPVIKKADIIVINSDKHNKNLSFTDTFGRKNVKAFWINLQKRKGELHEFLCFVKERINTFPH